MALLVRFGWVCLFPNQIEGFFDQQYLSKKSLHILVSYEWRYQQEKAASEILDVVIKRRWHLGLALLIQYGWVYGNVQLLS